MKFEMGAAWSDAVAMMSGNREVLAIVAGIFFFLPSLLMTLLGPDFAALMTANTMDPEDIEAMMAGMTALYADYWWLIAIAAIAQILGYLALLALLRDDAKPTVGEAIATGAMGLLPAIAAYVVFVVGITLTVGLLIGAAAAAGSQILAGLVVVLAIPVMFYLMIKVSLAGPVIAIDKVFNPFTVLIRSWKLTKGNSFRLFLFYLLLVIVYFVLSSVVGIVIVGLIFALGDGAGKIVNGLISGLVSAAATVVMVSVLAAIHRQLAGPSAGAVSETFQ